MEPSALNLCKREVDRDLLQLVTVGKSAVRELALAIKTHKHRTAVSPDPGWLRVLVPHACVYILFHNRLLFAPYFLSTLSYLSHHPLTIVSVSSPTHHYHISASRSDTWFFNPYSQLSIRLLPNSALDIPGIFLPHNS